MSTNSLKSKIIRNITEVEDLNLLKEIKAMLAIHKKEKQANIPANKENEIALAQEQFKNGHFSNHEEVEKRFSKCKN